MFNTNAQFYIDYNVSLINGKISIYGYYDTNYLKKIFPYGFYRNSLNNVTLNPSLSSSFETTFLNKKEYMFDDQTIKNNFYPFNDIFNIHLLSGTTTINREVPMEMVDNDVSPVLLDNETIALKIQQIYNTNLTLNNDFFTFANQSQYLTSDIKNKLETLLNQIPRTINLKPITNFIESLLILHAKDIAV